MKKKFTDDQIIAILKEAQQGELSTEELCMDAALLPFTAGRRNLVTRPATRPNSFAVSNEKTSASYDLWASNSSSWKP